MYGPPPSIEAGQSPGGLVVHLYDWTGKLLRVSRITDDTADIEADAVAELFYGLQGPGYLVAYDGDTGQRQHEGWRQVG